MFSVITIDNIEKWNEIVNSFQHADVYYLPQYTKAFQLHGDGEPTLFYYEDDDMKAMNVVMKRDISKDHRFAGEIKHGEFFDAITPYGYGGFLIEGSISEDRLKKLEEGYLAICKKEKIICEFVRFHPVLQNSVQLEKVYDVSKRGKSILMNLQSKEQIWNDLTSKNRNMIRKAQKNGVEIFWGRNPQLVDKFMPMYNGTMKKRNAKTYYYFEKAFFDCILHELKYNSLFFYALYEGKIIAMSLMMCGNKQVHYHLSAADKDYLHLAPTNLLLYEAACWGCENGFDTFHLGGGLGSDEDSLYKFKKAFNRNQHLTFFIGKKIFDDEKYEQLVSIRRKEEGFDETATYFPIYRA